MIRVRTMTICEWMARMKHKNEHYGISDAFVKDYQQGKTGYIKYAMQVGYPIKKSQAEPNQKWHLFESYLHRRLADEKLSLEDSAEAVYKRLKCPELLLWIAEASGVDCLKVKEAANRAKEIIDSGSDGRARNKAGQEIVRIISWRTIEQALIEK